MIFCIVEDALVLHNTKCSNGDTPATKALLTVTFQPAAHDAVAGTSDWCGL